MVEINNVNFLLKLIAMIINLIILLIWASDSLWSGIPVNGRGAVVLFLITNCGYVLVLCALVALYLLDEIPGQLAQRLFIVTGVILFSIVGFIGLFDNDGGDAALNAILCIVVAVLLLVDFIKSEGFF